MTCALRRSTFQARNRPISSKLFSFHNIRTAFHFRNGRLPSKTQIDEIIRQTHDETIANPFPWSNSNNTSLLMACSIVIVESFLVFEMIARN
eukprot:snap_masked-scaffold_5-processed-gene-15.39-mRNA-1 protein AED:1.00 eAED:1.00 QI:0/0/0/0/1/1/3/0/91